MHEIVRWRRVDLQQIVAERFGVAYHERTIGKILKQLGFSHVSARPRHPAERLAVDRPVEEPWRLDPVVPQGGEERHRPPVAMRHLGGQALAARRPEPERSHVGLGPGLVDEDEAGGIDEPLPRRPLGPSPRHVGAVLFGRNQRLFL